MFFEAELAAMNPFAAEALNRVMDDKIAEKLLGLFSSEDYSRAKENHICANVFRQFEEFMYPVVYPIRLIEDLKTTKLSGSTITHRDLLYRLEPDQETLDYISSRPDSISEILALLQKIRVNGSKIPTEYAARKKVDYDYFYDTMQPLNVRAELIASEFNLKRNPNFLRDIQSNQRLFYVPGESRRSTGYLGIAGKRVKLAQIENGLKYQSYLKNKGISREIGRIFI